MDSSIRRNAYRSARTRKRLCQIHSVKLEDIVGHTSRHLSKNMLLHGGHITCEVIGKRKKGNGLEVPCIYTFTGTEKLVNRIIKHSASHSQQSDRSNVTMASCSQESLSSSNTEPTKEHAV